MSDILSIVIPTRDRIDLLRLALASIYERQARIPPVIVSDNSTSVDPQMEGLRLRYGFAYVRQSGQVPLTDHHNACLAMPSTPWVWLLHDDDEIVPGAIADVELALADCGDVGILVGGVEYIDREGEVVASWAPKSSRLRGEEAMRAIGLDWQARAPGQIFSIEAARTLGGYANTAGLTGDYAFAVLMGSQFGVAFHPRIIGRFRVDPSHASAFYSSPQAMTRYLEFFSQQAKVIAASGCSPKLLAALTDYLMWNSLWQMLQRHGARVPALTAKVLFCMERSPHEGEWLNRVRKEFPILFWRPTRLWLPLFSAAVAANALLRRVSGGKSGAVARVIRPLLFGTGR